MKKQTKLEKRRKTVLGAVLGFGAVALLTTATATWIIAVNNSTADETLNVTVDSAINNAVNVIVGENGDMGIRLAEATTVTADGDKVVTTDGLEGGVGDLKITLPDITVEYGGDWLGSKSNIVISLALEYAGGKNSANLVADDKIGKRGEIEKDVSLTSEQGGPASYWTYIDLSETKSFTVEKADSDVNGVYTVSLEGQEVTLEWGSFFNGMSPADFYNSLFTNGEPSESVSKITLADAANIQAELAAMATALTGDTITLTLSVSNS